MRMQKLNKKSNGTDFVFYFTFYFAIIKVDAFLIGCFVVLIRITVLISTVLQLLLTTYAS